MQVEGFVEKVCFEFGVEESGNDGMARVVMMEQVSLDEWNKKSMKEND